FSPAQCAELWRRYKAGESILGIGRALGGRASAIHRVLQSTGGIAPAERRRSSRVLSLVEREEISRGIAAGYTIRAIARSLNRAVSTVSQEVSLHGGRELYRAAEADLAAWESARSREAGVHLTATCNPRLPARGRYGGTVPDRIPAGTCSKPPLAGEYTKTIESCSLMRDTRVPS